MKKIIILLGMLGVIALPYQSFAWSYPLKEVSKIACKFSPWSEHGEECKIQLPRIENADYKKYKDNIQMRLIYSVLWASTYTNGWDIGNGSHLGVDIATAKGTPVYSIGDGEIVLSKNVTGRGNAIVIKHKFKDKYIFSAYAHLNKIMVGMGDKVKEGDKIGEVGNTGNAWGNHLHFQMDINQYGSHPYYYSSCKGSPETIVDNGTCQDLLYGNTIDPIAFLETNGATLNFNFEKEDIVEKKNEEHVQEQRISPNDIVSRKQLMLSELEFFLAKYDITTKSLIPANVLSPGKSGNIAVEVKTAGSEKSLYGILPMPIKVEYDESMVSVLPTSMEYIEGTRNIKIKALKEGTTQVFLKIGGKIIGTYKIRITDKSENIQAKNSSIQILGKSYVGSENRGLALMKDENMYNIIDVPYDGTFYVKSNHGMIMCPVIIKTAKDIAGLNSFNCTSDKMTQSFQFKYEDTLKGIIIFKIIPNSTTPLKITVENQDGNRIGGNVPEKIVSYPNDLKKSDEYYKYISSLLEKNIIKNKWNGNFDKEGMLSEYDANLWIKNAFPKSTYKKGNKSKFLTRMEFLKMFSDKAGKKAKDLTKKFWDIKGDDINYANLLLDYGFQFNDKYGDKYFQPTKKISRQEAAYIMYMLSK